MNALAEQRTSPTQTNPLYETTHELIGESAASSFNTPRGDSTVRRDLSKCHRHVPERRDAYFARNWRGENRISM